MILSVTTAFVFAMEKSFNAPHLDFFRLLSYMYSQIHVLWTMVVVIRCVLLVGPVCVLMATLWTLTGKDAMVCPMFKVPVEALTAISTF